MSADHASDSAVLVIDVQRGLFEGSPAVEDGAGVLGRINAVLRHARAAGRPILFFQHEEHPDLLADTEPWQLHPELERLPGDQVFRKRYSDAFVGVALEEELRRLGAQTLIIMGCSTEYCIDSTVRAASARGYRVIVVSDAHTTFDGPSLSGRQIIAFHNSVWPNIAANPPIATLPADWVCI